MKVYNLNITQITNSYIFCTDLTNNKKVRLACTNNVNILKDIKKKAIENILFYERMWREIKERGDELIAEVELKYPEIAEPKNRDLNARINYEIRCEQRRDNFHYAHGFKHAMVYALNNKEEADKILRQVNAVLNTIETKKGAN